jgi:hypothetical protein
MNNGFTGLSVSAAATPPIRRPPTSKTMLLPLMTSRSAVPIGARVVIGITTPDFCDAEHPGLFKVGDDSPSCAFGDADKICDLTLAQVRITSEADKNMRVITEEGPSGTLVHKMKRYSSRKQFQCEAKDDRE